MNAEIKTPPNSKEAEMIVLGCMMTSTGSLNVAADLLEETDFYYLEHKAIFSALKELFLQDKPADIHLVAEELKQQDKLKGVGGVAYLTSLAQYAGTAAHIEEYAELIRNHSLLRRIVSTAQELEREALDHSADPSELLGKLQKKSVDLGKFYSSNDKASIGEILSGKKSRVSDVPLVQRLQKRQEFYTTNNKPFMTGIPTGYTDIDNKVTILEETNLIYLAARPSMGKTALALNIASHVCFEQKLPVGFISMEMGADQLVERLISIRTKIPGESLKRGTFTKENLKRIQDEEELIRRGKFFIYDTNCNSIAQLTSKARRIKDEDDIQLLIIDYLQLLGTDKAADSRQYEVAEVSRRLKLLAMELKIPVLCVAQLSRKLEERSDKKPLMSDLRDSGQAEQDADVVAFIHRDEYFNRESSNKKGIAEVFLGKNRHGPTPSIELHFDQNCGTFSNLLSENHKSSRLF